MVDGREILPTASQPLRVHNPFFCPVRNGNSKGVRVADEKEERRGEDSLFCPTVGPILSAGMPGVGL